MRAPRIAVLHEPVVEVALGRGVDAIAEEDVLALGRILRVHLFRDFRIRCGLSAAVIAHHDDVLEARAHCLFGDALEHGAENFRREADRARKIGARVVRGVREHREPEGVAETVGDGLDDFGAHQRVAAIDVLWSALLGASRVDERGRLAGRERGLHLGPRHHRELVVLFF